MDDDDALANYDFAAIDALVERHQASGQAERQQTAVTAAPVASCPRHVNNLTGSRGLPPHAAPGPSLGVRIQPLSSNIAQPGPNGAPARTSSLYGAPQIYSYGLQRPQPGTDSNGGQPASQSVHNLQDKGGSRCISSADILQPHPQQKVLPSETLPQQAYTIRIAPSASGHHPAPGHPPSGSNQVSPQYMPPPPHVMQQQRQYITHEQGPPRPCMQHYQHNREQQVHQNPPPHQQQLQKPLPPPDHHHEHQGQVIPQQQPQQQLRQTWPQPLQQHPNQQPQTRGPQREWPHPLQQQPLQQPVQQHQPQPQPAGQQQHRHPLQQQQQPGAQQPAQAPAAAAAGHGHHPTTAASGKATKLVKLTATLDLEEGKRIAIKVPYHNALEAVFSLITDPALYNSKIRGWTFPMSQYKHVLDALRDGRLRTRGVEVELQQPQPAFVGRMLLEAASRPNDERLYEKLTRGQQAGEQSLDEKMMPFQREGVKHALRLGGRVLIGDEMGLGKTVQACCILWCYSEWPALIVVPKSLRDTWADALFTWLKLAEDEVFVFGSSGDADKLDCFNAGDNGKKVLIISYDQLLRVHEKIRALKPQTVVLDEAHYIKNGKAKRTQASLPIITDARRAVLLTGTPALSKPAELVPLLQSLMKTAAIKSSEFSDRYSIPDKRFPGRFFGARNEMELNRLLQCTVLVRRLKSEVLKHLPAKRRQKVFIRLADKDMRKVEAMGKELAGIKAVANSMEETGSGGLLGVSREQQNTTMRLYRETASLKAAAVAEYCADLLEADGAKFLLFAHHKVLLDAVEDQAKKSGAAYIRIDGETSAEDRAAFVKRFQEDTDVKVAVLSIKAAGVGLTMTACSLVVFAELTWVPGDIQQAEDRCHRIGQHTSVNIHFLLVRGSIDEIMWETVQTKLGSVGKVLDGSGASIKVDETREVHGLGTGGPQQPGCPAGDAHHGLPNRSGSSGRDSAAGPLDRPAKVVQNGRSAVTAVAGSTRRISDYFAGQKRGRAGVEHVDLIDDGDVD